MKKTIFSLMVLFAMLVASCTTPAQKALIPVATPFTFVSIGDAQGDPTRFAKTLDQIATLNPDLIIFNGDLENDGTSTSELDAMVAKLKAANLFDRTFIVRGNHDNRASGSAAAWEKYFETAPNIATRPAGVTNYVSLNSSSDKLTYSFDYSNSIFIGMDVPGDVQAMTSAQYAFVDARLTYAEQAGFTHAFIFWHGPDYCVESVHCSCTAKLDGKCTPASWVTLVNKHPIISATFHGHEHISGWVHMDSKRVPSLIGSYEEFITSPSGGYSYNQYVYPNRLDYYDSAVGSTTVFSAVGVVGTSYGVRFFEVGKTTPIKTMTFSKAGDGTSVPTLTSASITNAAPTVTRTATAIVPRTVTPSVVPITPGSGRQILYYVFDRVPTSDFAKLVTLGGPDKLVFIVSFDVHGTESSWRSVFSAAQANGVKIVIWPSDWTYPRGESACNWENPFPVTTDGDIHNVTNLMSVASEYSSWLGIVSTHEPQWNCVTPAGDTASNHENAGLYSKLRAFAASKGRLDVQVWAYLGNVNSVSTFPDSAIGQMMDVLVEWKHCAGNAEAPCSAVPGQVTTDRARLTKLGLEGKVRVVFVAQTFTTIAPWNVKFSLSELESFTDSMMQTGALDGYGYYTWYANWYNGDLSRWPDLQPVIPWFRDKYLNGQLVTPIPTTPVPTRTRTPTPIITPIPTILTPMPVWTIVLECVGQICKVK